MLKLVPDKRKRVERRRKARRRARALRRLVENNFIHRVSYDEYRNRVRNVYDGPQGAFLATCSMLSGHLAMGERLLREKKFDLAGVKNILDVGSGAGQIAKHLLKYADDDANITCFDLSHEMLRRARNRLKSDRPRFVTADMTQLPFPDASFDCITCGYVLEHLPDPKPGLAELARVLVPGGRMLLLATEDRIMGAWTSRLWLCRTFDRRQLNQVCSELGLRWKEEIWFSKIHRALHAGGICVWIERV